MDWFIRERGEPTNTSPTNRTLIKLLSAGGYDIGLPRDTVGRGEIFLTNAILCLKQGGAQARVKPEWFENCRSRFLRPLIELVRPRVVVGLGQQAYMAILRAYGLQDEPFKAAVARSEPVGLVPGISAFAVYHCGARILNTHRKIEEQIRDWERIGA